MSEKYLVQVSIGPVQDFIADARKVRDLCIGSKLLSCVTREAIMPFLKGDGVEIIIPPREFVEKKNASIPNQFLAIIPEEKLDTIIKDSREAVDSFWRAISQQIKEKVPRNLVTDAPAWEYQLKELWQYMWVAVPMTNDEMENKYGEKAKAIQKALEERKITRTFEKWQGSGNIKCTQSGKREIMGIKSSWVKAGENTSGKIKSGDKLCAVCLAKRFIGEDMLGIEKIRFESSSDIAAVYFKKELKEKLADGSKLNDFLNSANNLLAALERKKVENIDDIPGILFFEEELRMEALAKEFFPWVDIRKESEHDELEKKIKGPAEQFEKELKAVKKEYGIEPCKYYTLLGMDGDKMGEYIASVCSKEEQGGKSRLIAELADEMPNWLKGEGWTSVYCGGDDILAMGPLSNALDIALGARQKFESKLSGKTISAALVITHYHNPLRKSLQILRESVEKAKDTYQRNSMVVAVWLSSGTVLSTGYRWNELEWDGAEEKDKPKELLPELLSWLRNGVSSAFIYDVISELDAFYYDDKFEEDMFQPEATRLFKRHLDGEKKFNPAAEKLLEKLSSIANPQNRRYLHNDNKAKRARETREDFVNMLRTASFIDRQRVRGEQKKEKGE